MYLSAQRSLSEVFDVADLPHLPFLIFDETERIYCSSLSLSAQKQDGSVEHRICCVFIHYLCGDG